MFVADHPGPAQTILAVAEQFENACLVAPEGVSGQAPSVQHLPCESVDQPDLVLAGAAALVRGCSEVEPGAQDLEHRFACLAREGGIPVIAIEDFPGNYRCALRAPLDAVFLEHAPGSWSEGVACHVERNPRYARWANEPYAKLRPACRRQLALEGPVVLWLGQPDSSSSRDTFRVLVPELNFLGATLLFRAHPRDRLYRDGGYVELLAECRKVHDVTNHPRLSGLYAAADLAVTQFSSAAVEAACCGTPAMFVLLPQAGRRLLTALKKLDTLPWIEERAAFVAWEEAAVPDVLARALLDDEARQSVIQQFARRFTPDHRALARIAAKITELADKPPATKALS